MLRELQARIVRGDNGLDVLVQLFHDTDAGVDVEPLVLQLSTDAPRVERQYRVAGVDARWAFNHPYAYIEATRVRSEANVAV